MLFAVASAQELTPEQVQRQIAQQLQYMQSPRQQVHFEADQLGGTRASWNGQGAFMPLGIMLRSGGEAELGLTEEQNRLFAPIRRGNEMAEAVHGRIRENPPPELLLVMEAHQAAMLPDDPLFERATEEQKDALRDAKMLGMSFMTREIQALIEETLTAEQMLQVRKLEMQLMPAMGIPFPSMFEPLGLTDEQKEEMNKITDEMKAEFDRLTMEEAKLKGERMMATYGLLEGKSFASHEEFQKARQEVISQYVPSEAIRKRYNDLREQGIKFTTLLQNRLMDVLTDEQLVKMQEILDATPEFAKQMIAQFKAGQEEAKKSPTYIPGPDAWRPGDPMPMQIKEERQRGRFPRGENN